MDDIIRLMVAIGILAPILAAAYVKLRSVDRRQQWDINSLRREVNGVYLRGMVRAKKKNFVVWANGRERLGGPRQKEIEQAFATCKPELQKLYRDLQRLYGRRPDYVEVAMAIEQTHQRFLVETICPLIGEEAHECVAIAYCVASSNGSADHTPESWQQSTSSPAI